MRCVSKTVNAEPARLAGFAIRSVADQSSRKQRSYVHIVVLVGQMKTIARVGNSEIGVATVDGVTGELRAVTKIFAIRSAISAFAIGPSKPRNADAIANRKLVH